MNIHSLRGRQGNNRGSKGTADRSASESTVVSASARDIAGLALARTAQNGAAMSLVRVSVLVVVLAAASAARAETPEEGPLEYLHIDKVSLFLDGGTVTIDGQVWKQKVHVRYDNAIGSPTRGAIFMRRGEGPEVEMEAADLEQLGQAIKRDVSARAGLKNIGRAISNKLVAAGLETRGRELLRTFRVTDVDRWGFPRGDFKMKGVTRYGDRTLLFFDGKVMVKPRSYEHYDLPARPLDARERSDLLRALNKAAIARLPNRSMRSAAKRMRDSVAAEHQAARPARARRTK